MHQRGSGGGGQGVGVVHQRGSVSGVRGGGVKGWWSREWGDGVKGVWW